MIPVPQSILYAGLAGVVIALIVATATQRWQLRVFVLLALRLAIGWHFLFEGLHKIHSQHVGPTETNKAFTSEFFFATGEGPLAEKMRKDYLGDPVATYTARLTQPKPMTADEFKKLKPEEQIALCPQAVVAELDAAVVTLNQEATKLREEASKLPEGTSDEKRKKAEADADAKATAAEARAKRAPDEIPELKARYTAWVYGAAGRETKVKFVSGDVAFTGPQRLRHIEMLEKELKSLEERQNSTLGRGDSLELTKTKTARTDLLAAKNDLAKDSDVTNELRALVDAPPLPPSRDKMKTLDKWTAWGITAIGACILLGLFTPLACLAGAGFLAMTYLTHPTVPWLSLPPMTEGNPLFINKNIIEALALLVVAVHPTGRWLGLDALWTYFFQPKAEPTRV